MAGYRIPTFNLVCKVWSRSAVPPGPVNTATLGAFRIDNVPCQLRGPQRVWAGEDSANFWAAVIEICFPKLTDVRDNFSWDGASLAMPDLIECPQGSQVYYTCVAVYDVGKGFANEYRIAVAYKNGRCPIPMP